MECRHGEGGDNRGDSSSCNASTCPQTPMGPLCDKFHPVHPLSSRETVPMSSVQLQVQNDAVTQGSASFTHQLGLLPGHAADGSQLVLSLSMGNSQCVTPNLGHSLESDQRTVMQKVQRVSCVRVADGCDCDDQSSVMGYNSSNDMLRSQSLSADTLSRVIKDVVLCMLRRDENINLVASRSYLAMRFPEILKEYRDPVIISEYTAAQKVALTYMDTLHDDATERNVWSRNYLHKWSHGLASCEPPLKYIPTKKPPSVMQNADLYSPATNFLVSKKFPVSLESQREEFDRNTEQIVANVQACAGVNVSDVSETGNNSVTKMLVPVAESLISLSSANADGAAMVAQGQQSQSELPMEVVTTMSTDAVTSVCADVPASIPSMPDLSEFIPVVVDGKVQSVSGNDMCDVEPMQQGPVPSSPVVNTFNDLLRVENINGLELDELTKPLLDLVTPITSPEVKRSNASKHESVTDTSDTSQSPDLATTTLKSVALVKQGKSVQGEKKSGKSPRKWKLCRPELLAKENLKPRDGNVGVSSTGKKMIAESKAKGSVSHSDKTDVSKRRKKSDTEGRGNHKGESIETVVRDQRCLSSKYQ